MAICSGFSHEKWWFSIVMLVYQRVPTAKVRIISSHESTVTWVASWSWSRYRSDSHMGRFCAYKPAMGLIGKVPLWRNDKIRKYIYIYDYICIYIGRIEKKQFTSIDLLDLWFGGSKNAASHRQNSFPPRLERGAPTSDGPTWPKIHPIAICEPWCCKIYQHLPEQNQPVL